MYRGWQSKGFGRIFGLVAVAVALVDDCVCVMKVRVSACSRHNRTGES
jgi:hypothetical protein